MRRRQRCTLERLFEAPERADVSWRDVESLFTALAAEVSAGRGSRVRIAPGGVRAVFHRPHPRKVLGKGMVRSVRRFLTEAGGRP